MLEKLEETKRFLEERINTAPTLGLITGTGLGKVTEPISVAHRIPYDQIPNFPKASVEGHSGTLVVGSLGGLQVLAMEGRFHLYEGYTPQEVTFPVRLMALLGVETIFISSAAGGLNPGFNTGELMIVTDHINLTGTSPLIGPNLDTLGPRFPDMSSAYDKGLISVAKDQALEAKIPLREGVYVGIPGPNLETPAETRFLRMIGGDAVGMSTVNEVIAAVHAGLKVAAIVVITNVNRPDCMEKTDIKDVISASEQASPVLAQLWESIAIALSTDKAVEIDTKNGKDKVKKWKKWISWLKTP